MRHQAKWLPAIVLSLLALEPTSVWAQNTAQGVVSFLLTPRSIATGDTGADNTAAAAVREALTESIDADAWPPASTSGGGFAFRPDSTLGGAAVRSSASFGGFVTDRSVTSGERRGTVTIHYRHLSFDAFGGHNLRDGTLRATATRLTDETVPIDVESLALRVDADVTTFAGTYGVSDRLDVTALVPLVRVSVAGERLDTYRGHPATQVSSGAATASGMGDIEFRGKYNLFRDGPSGAAMTAALRLPTGRDEDFLGRGEATVHPGFVWSFEQPRVTIDGNVGVEIGSRTRDVIYGAAVTLVARPRVMVVGEMAGRRIDSAWQLEESIAPRPGPSGVDVLRLSAIEASTQQFTIVGGVKWNPVGAWVVSGNVMRQLTTAGVTANWVPSMALEYTFAR